MRLTLVLESAPGLTGEAASRMEFADRQSLSIGRAELADWRLTDAQRLISSVHCEIRREAGAYVVHDRSANGTFVNASQTRLAAPHPLRDGDSLTVGGCVIRADLSDPEANSDATRVIRGGIETLAPAQPAPAPAPAPALHLSLTPETAAAQSGPTSITVSGNAPLSIGRDAQAGWVLSDNSGRVSRVHCEIRLGDGGFQLHDLSRNGTFLHGRGERLSGPHPVRPGDRFAIGDFVVAVAAPDAVRQSAPAAAGTEPPAAPPTTPRRGGDPAAMVVRATPAAASGCGHAMLREPQSPRIESTMLLPAAASPVRAGPTPQDAAAEGPASAALRHLAAGLGLSPSEIAATDATTLCEEVGSLLRLLAEEMASLLAECRAQDAAAGRPAREPMRPQGNNPLESLPAEEAVRVLFGPPRRAYLDARRSFQVGFERLRRHCSALERQAPEAVRATLDRLAPESIAQAVPRPGPLGRITGSNKAALWDDYVRRWSQARADTA